MLNKILLILIVALALFLRVIALSQNPPSLNWDEVSLGYNAYSILHTGKDEWGEALPLIFRAYGDYKLPGYIYTLVPFIRLFELNEFSVRLPSVLAGTASVYLTYLIVLRLFSNNIESKNRSGKTTYYSIALLSSLLVAIEPWSYFLSRPALEANLALFFFLAGFYFFLRSLYSKFNILYSILFFGFSVWTYNSYRIFTPLFIFLITIIFRNEVRRMFVKRKTIVYTLIPSIVLFFPMFYQLIYGPGGERYQKVTIIDDGAVGQIINNRNNYNLNPYIEKIIFNRPVYFTYQLSRNIISHLSPDFLFVKGGTNYQFSVPGYGQLYKVNFIFLILGVFFLFKRRDKISILLVGWFLLGTIPSSLTREAPHVLRSITMLPVPMIITSIGFIYAVNIFRNLKFEIPFRFIIYSIYILLIMLSLNKYLNIYFGSYRNDYSWSWQYGYKKVVNYITQNSEKYDKVIITKKYGEPHEFLLFYTKYEPKLFQENKNLIRFRQSDWFWVDRFDEFYFVNDWDVPREEWQPFVLESGKENVDCRNISCLLVTSPGNYPKTWNKLETINFLDGKPVFEIYSNSTKRKVG